MKPGKSRNIFQKILGQKDERREGTVISTPVTPRKDISFGRSNKSKEDAEAVPAPTLPVEPAPAPPVIVSAPAESPEELKPMRPPRPGTSSPFKAATGSVAPKKEAVEPPLLPRRRIKDKPRLPRVINIASWKVRRRIVRAHTRRPLAVVALFYLGLAAAGMFLITGYFFVSSPARTVSNTPLSLPPEKLARKLYGETGALMGQKKYDEAWKKVQQLKQMEPANPSVYLIEGAILATKKKYDEARACFNKAKELSPQSFAPSFNLAEMEFTAGNYAEAERQYRELRKVYEPSKLVLFRIYLCAIMQGNRDDAASISNSVDLDEQSPEWHYIRAIEAYRSGRKSEARQIRDNARILFGKSTEAHDQTLERLELLK